MSDPAAPLFDDLWDFNDPAATADRFLTLLPAAEAGRATDPATAANYLGQLQTQIARTFSLRRRFDEAHAYLDKVEAALTPALPIVHIRYLLERGRTFNSSGAPAAALPLFVEAFERAVAAGVDFYAVDAAHMAAIVEPDPAEQLAWNEKAVALAEQSESERTRRWLGSLYNNIGWTYHDGGRYDDALAVFVKALACREAEKDDGAAARARIARWCVARTKRSLGQLEEALAEQQALAAYYDASAEEDGFVEEELGEILLALDRDDEARPHLQRAYAILSQDVWLQANEKERLARLHALSVDPEADDV